MQDVVGLIACHDTSGPFRDVISLGLEGLNPLPASPQPKMKSGLPDNIMLTLRRCHLTKQVTYV